MFYSHEVLTSRKYGVATVWLVATLGSKSSLKKVSRKAILDVDVVKACETIGTPEAPLALRLQSNLLYGVTRVFAQQCGYVLNDVEQAKNTMRLMFKAVQASSLDAEQANKGRTDQLMLPDDPNFLPDFDLMPMDLDRLELDLTIAEESQRTTLSPHNSQAAGRGMDLGSQQDIGDLVIPPSDSSIAGSAVGGFGSFSIRGDAGKGTRSSAGGMLDDDLGLGIDDDGNIRMSDAPGLQPRAAMVHSEGIGIGDAVDEVIHENADNTILHNSEDNIMGQPDDDEFVPLLDDDNVLAPESAAQHSAQQAPEQDQSPQQITSEETAEAPLRRRPRAANKAIPFDQTMELRSADLARWTTNYLANMNEALRVKNAHKATAIAKKNAEHWILGNGDRGPLSIFQGAQLLETLTGIRLVAAGEKRRREDDEEDDVARRVRSRGEPSPEEVDRGQQEDDGFIPAMGDDTIEQGREAPTPLDEGHLSSMMPWNQSAGSRRPTGLFSGQGGLPTSASFGGAAGAMSRRGSRLTSASPLMGRGTIGDNMDDFQLPGSAGDVDVTGEEAFELFGPAAQVDTQTAAQSQWQRTALDSESHHFLEFVQTSIEELDLARAKAAPGDEEDETLQGTIAFDNLLPLKDHSCIVAAQGLLHVLALGTKGMLQVEQDEAFGPITLQVLASA